MWWIVGLGVVALIIALVIRLVIRAGSEDGRIRTFIRIYQQARRLGSVSDALAAVCAVHIPPGKSRPLSAYGVSGSEYLKQVFEDRHIDIKALVAHFIRLEFPAKYPMNIDLAKIREANRGGKPTERDLLNARIKHLMDEAGVDEEPRLSGKALGVTMRVLLAIVSAILSACAHTPLEGCLPDSAVIERGHRLAVLDWSTATEDRVAAAWPGGFNTGSHNSGYGCAPCTGTAEYLDQNRVIVGEPVCLQLVILTEAPFEGDCKSRLHAVVFRQTTHSSSAARALAEELLREFVGEQNAVLPQSLPIDVDRSWDDTPARGLSTFVSLNVARKYGGFHVYFYVSRDVTPNSTLYRTPTAPPVLPAGDTVACGGRG